jgi:hypothetical protein
MVFSCSLERRVVAPAAVSMRVDAQHVKKGAFKQRKCASVECVDANEKMD